MFMQPMRGRIYKGANKVEICFWFIPFLIYLWAELSRTFGGWYLALSKGFCEELQDHRIICGCSQQRHATFAPNPSPKEREFKIINDGIICVFCSQFSTTIWFAAPNNRNRSPKEEKSMYRILKMEIYIKKLKIN